MVDKVKIELPNTDAVRVFSSMAEMRRFLAFHELEIGDLVHDEEFDVFRVPKFAEGREKFIKKKIEECDKWGCE